MINIEENDYEIVPEKIINFFIQNKDLFTRVHEIQKIRNKESVLGDIIPIIDEVNIIDKREVEKYLGDTLNVNGIELPYLSWSCNSVLAAHVVEEYDLGSHTLFIAELDEAIKLNDNPPLTYEYYQSNIKPKPEMPKSDKKIIGWRCKICGFEYEGETLPEDYLCPLCGHDASDFEPIYEN